jgi:hypothetical protein
MKRLQASRQYAYPLACGASAPDPAEPWDGSVWRHVPCVAVNHFHPRSSTQHSQTQAKAIYHDRRLYVRFHVQDRYVRCVHDLHQQPVYTDSCVEFFVQPDTDKGYFNFEVNCGGAMLLYYVQDWAVQPDGSYRHFTPLSQNELSQVQIRATMPPRVEPEIAQPLTWEITLRIPLELFERYLGPLDPRPGSRWRANFYKCGDETSHPHWAAWSPIGKELNFHQPRYFGELVFQEPAPVVL